MKQITLTVSIFLLCSCNWFYSTVTGIKDSRFESEEYQKKYLLSKGIDTSFMAYFNKSFYSDLAKPSHSLDTFKNMGYTPIQFRVFDKHGNFFSGWEICFGDAEKAGVYTNFPHKEVSRWPLNNQLTLKNDLKYIVPINFDLNETIKRMEAGSYEYVVISFWAGYLGKHSARMLKNLDQQMSNSQNILHIKVNLSD